MSTFRTLLVLFMDEAAKARWRSPIVRAAETAGVAIIERSAGAAYESQSDAVILTDDINWTMLLPPEDAAFFSDAALPVPSCDRPSMIERSLIFEHSRRLVVAAHLNSRGAPVFGQNDLTADMALVGRVVAEPHQIEHELRGPSPLDMYRSIPLEVGASAVWGGGLFAYPAKDQLDGGDPHIDLTGRSRAVVHGPYYYLPPGVWRSVTHFTIDPEGGEARLRMEWGTGQEMTSQSLVFTTAGQYALELQHTWSDSGPSQLVVWVERPLFQGRMTIERCDVQLVGDLVPVEPDASEERSSNA